MEDIFDYVRAAAGATIAICAPFIEQLQMAGQVVGMLGGFYMLFLSIKHKKLQIKNEQNKRPL